MRISDWSSDVCSSDLRDAARRRVRAFPAECLRAKRMGTPPYCPYAFDGHHMSIRPASVSGRWPAWVGLGFASIAVVAMAAGPVEPDANTPADAAASVPATELDRVVEIGRAHVRIPALMRNTKADFC